MKLGGNVLKFVGFLFLTLLMMGCKTSTGNVGQLKSYPVPSLEAEWIRNGEPIEFEGDLWYPADGIESLVDSEVYMLGEYRDVRFFIDKRDVRPYNRLYTKFGRNRFRYFKKRESE